MSKESAAAGPAVPGERPVLLCRGRRKSFGDRVAVAGVGFSISPGETYGLLGPNGAGKTTTISMVCGLLRRDAGEVEVAGRRLDDEPLAVKAAIGLVPQEIALYPDLTGRENLRFFGRLYGLAGLRLTERVDHGLDVVGLLDRADEAYRLILRRYEAPAQHRRRPAA